MEDLAELMNEFPIIYLNMSVFGEHGNADIFLSTI